MGPKDLITPIINKLNRPFWEAAERRELVLPWCTTSEQHFWPPGPLSPFHLHTPISWRAAKPAGALVGGIIYRRSFLPELEPLMPYGIGFVALDDGPRLQVHLRDITLAMPDKTGKRVEIFFEPMLPGYPAIPMARLSSSQR